MSRKVIFTCSIKVNQTKLQVVKLCVILVVENYYYNQALNPQGFVVEKPRRISH